jgi:hypothetical protein
LQPSPRGQRFGENCFGGIAGISGWGEGCAKNSRKIREGEIGEKEGKKQKKRKGCTFRVRAEGALPRSSGMAFPILGKSFRARFGRVLIMVGIQYQLSSIVIKGVSQNPIGGVVGDGVSYPLDMVQELAFVMGMVVFGINDSFNEVLRFSVNNNRQWGWLFTIVKGVGGLGLQL